VTYAVLKQLHAVQTLRIDTYQHSCVADMCATLINMANRPRPTQMKHLALRGLTLPPDSPQLVAAVQAHTQLVVRRLQRHESI
jgi:hypothetical protein